MQAIWIARESLTVLTDYSFGLAQASLGLGILWLAHILCFLHLLYFSVYV